MLSSDASLILTWWYFDDKPVPRFANNLHKMSSLTASQIYNDRTTSGSSVNSVRILNLLLFAIRNAMWVWFIFSNILNSMHTVLSLFLSQSFFSHIFYFPSALSTTIACCATIQTLYPFYILCEDTSEKI